MIRRGSAIYQCVIFEIGTAASPLCNEPALDIFPNLSSSGKVHSLINDTEKRDLCMRRGLLARLIGPLFLLLLPLLEARSEEAPLSWADALSTSQGQTVYFNAWGGDPRINAYLDWAAEVLRTNFHIRLEHVKLADTAEAVNRIIAEAAAGKEDGGSIDVIWINGENFAALKEKGLLYGPFVESLPSNQFVDYPRYPTARTDFTIPTEGYEAPWGFAQFVLIYDAARVPEPPAQFADLLSWAKAHPGRLTYPAPPDFLGTTFLKQALTLLMRDPLGLPILQRPMPVEKEYFDRVTARLWQWLDALHPHLWRQGKAFPASSQQLQQMLMDGAVDFAFTFNPGGVASGIKEGLLPETAKGYVPKEGSLANSHFLAIPKNAANKPAALVTINFLLSPLAQLKKQDPEMWGDPTILAYDTLPRDDRERFVAVLQRAPLISGPQLPEPHPSWVSAIENAWKARYFH